LRSLTHTHSLALLTVFFSSFFLLPLFVFLSIFLFSQEVGGLDVPQHFSVPESAPWPEELWGLRLGSRVNAIRSQGTFVKNNPKRRELLTGMGFRWETEAGLRAKNYQVGFGFWVGTF